MPEDTNASTRQHAYSGPAVAQLPEPDYAERVRTLLSLGSVGMLSTVSRRQGGFPFGSLMPYALDAVGQPLFLISNMAMHTANVKADPRTSLFVSQGADGDPLGAARATLVGPTEPVPEVELADVRKRYLSRHENSRYWVDFKDFGFFRLRPVEVYYVGGFGVMGWVTAEDYSKASPDPLAEAAAGILTHMNADHVEAMLLLARHHSALQATEASMISVDRLGFNLRLKTGDGMKGTRINFPAEVRTPAETRTALVSMVAVAKPPQS